MKALKWILFLGAISFMTSGLAAQNLTVKGFANDEVEIRDILLEFPRIGKNVLTAALVNRRQELRNFVVDIRTEGVSLAMANYQSFYGFQVPGGQMMSIEVPYEMNAPAISRMIIRMGTIPEPFDREARNARSAAWQDEHPLPKPEYFWREIVTFDVTEQYRQSRDNSVDDHEILLSRIRKDELPEIKKKIQGLIKSRKGDERRDELRRAFYSGREYPASFDQRAGTWEGTYDYDAYIGDHDHFLSLFSISAEAGNRISGFFATRRDNAGEKRPLIVFLGGNPGGTKEVLVRRIFPLTLAGYHVLCVERRASSRKLDSLDKFRSNIADPVTDVIRTLDFIEQEYGDWISSIGIFGISQGAQEAKFVAALDDRIEAMVSVVGTTSNEALFRDKERWIPTLSGFIIFPAIGLPSPYLGGEELDSEAFQRYKDMAKPEHNLLAKEAYERLVPDFDDFDSVNVMPLVAPIPLLIVTGARDVQFTVDGVVEVDEAAHLAYKKYNLEQCHDLVIQPRAYHHLSPLGENAVMAFFKRWLQ